MAENIQIKNPSPLVKTVLALDAHYAELLRLGEKIETSDLKSGFDHEQAQKLLERFAEAGHGVTREVLALGQILTEVRARAETVAAAVAEKARSVNSRQDVVEQKIQEFAKLGEEVRDLNLAFQDLNPPEDRDLTDEERQNLREQLARFEEKIRPLIEKAESLQRDARVLKHKELERNAESLGQKLKSVSQNLLSVAPAPPTRH